jgi:peptidoglycan/LPS O-acetylase OafA/YrhL
VPALALLLVTFCVASFIFISGPKAISNYIDSAISFFYLSNWARAFSLHPPDFLGHTWSLAIEEQFYIIWPIVLLTMLGFSRNRKLIVLVAVSFALLSWSLRAYLHLSGATPERLFNGLDTRADALMLGSAIGIAHSSGMFEGRILTQTLSKVLVVAAPLSALSLLATSVTANWRAPYMYQFGFFAVALLTAIMMIHVIVTRRSLVGRLLATRHLVWVGRISYGLYLWHYPIFRAMFSLELTGLVVITVGSSITFLVASLSYYLMERPILALKRHFQKQPSTDGMPPNSDSPSPAEAGDASR